MPLFSGLANDSGKVPSKRMNKSLAPPEPEADSVAVINGGEIEYVEQTQETGSRIYTAFTVNLPQGAIAGQPGSAVRVLGNDHKRARVLISNGSSVPIYFGPLDQVSVNSGFLLPAGQLFDPQVQGEIYACVPADAAPSAGFAAIGVWGESDI